MNFILSIINKPERSIFTIGKNLFIWPHEMEKCLDVKLTNFIYIYIYIYIIWFSKLMHARWKKKEGNLSIFFHLLLLSIPFLLHLIQLFLVFLFFLLFSSSVCLTIWTNYLLWDLVMFSETQLLVCQFLSPKPMHRTT